MFSLTGKGYRLAVPMALYDEAQLQALAPMAPVHCFPVIDSTNQYLLERVNQLSSGESCLAECQTAGRGRRGKPWSPLRVPADPQHVLAARAGYGRCHGTESGGRRGRGAGAGIPRLSGVELKWPNDLYYQGRKLAGILVEMSGSAGASCHLVIGVGLNLAMPSREGDRSGLVRTAPHPAGTGRPQSAGLPGARSPAAGHAHLRTEWSRQFRGGLEPARSLRRYRVRLLMGEQEIRGVARGIDDRGALRLETAEGSSSTWAARSPAPGRLKAVAIVMNRRGACGPLHCDSCW